MSGLIRDKEVANLLGMSPSWVRVQRHKRKRNEGHVFTVDAVFIGRAARYREAEVQAWLDNLDRENAAILNPAPAAPANPPAQPEAPNEN